MPTLWIAAFPAVLVLVAAGWMLARRQRGAKAGQATPAPGTTTPRATDDESPAPRATGSAVSDNAAARPTDVPVLDTERVVLQRLCARAYADEATVPGPASAATQSAAEAAAIQVLARIGAHPRYTPRRPQLLPQLTRAINDPAASAQSIAAILAQDPALAGNLLRIANSATYRRQAAPIEQLERAVALLGTEGLRQTVMAALLQPVISNDGSVFARCAAILWDHTLLSANIAVRQAQGANRDDLHATQLLALLYGLGSVVVVQVLRDSWGKSGAGSPAPDTLVSLLDTWSMHCARAISADWGLSERVQRALEEPAGGSEDRVPGDLGRSLRIGRAQAADEMTGVPAPEPGGRSAP